MDLYDNRPIGIFDSGIGGLTVASQIVKAMPNENIIYFGDSKNAPYGNLSDELLRKHITRIIEYFITKNVKAIVIACNTATAFILDEAKEKYKDEDILFFGVIEPAIQEVVQVSKGKIGLLATNYTVKSNVHKNLLNKYSQKHTLIASGCTNLAGLIESGLGASDITYKELKRYMAEMLNENIDTVILGCTHYPLAKHAVKKVIGKNSSIKVIDPAFSTREYVKATLKNQKKLSSKREYVHIYTNGDVQLYNKIINLTFRDIYTTEYIEIK